MNQVVTHGIVLARINYGEADRILTVLTPEQGKRRLLAKGVRKSKSKMAGGVELFSISEVSYIPGKKDIDTLTSSRLKQHYANIVKAIDRTMAGYDFLKIINRCTEDQPDTEYFGLVKQLLLALDDEALSLDVVRFWFYAQLLALAGHTPNLQTDTEGQKLHADKAYVFSYDDMTFSYHPAGTFRANDIKLLRLAFGRYSASILQKVGELDDLLPANLQLVRTIASQHIKM